MVGRHRRLRIHKMVSRCICSHRYRRNDCRDSGQKNRCSSQETHQSQCHRRASDCIGGSSQHDSHRTYVDSAQLVNYYR